MAEDKKPDSDKNGLAEEDIDLNAATFNGDAEVDLNGKTADLPPAGEEDVDLLAKTLAGLPTESESESETVAVDLNGQTLPGDTPPVDLQARTLDGDVPASGNVHESGVDLNANTITGDPIDLNANTITDAASLVDLNANTISDSSVDLNANTISDSASGFGINLDAKTLIGEDVQEMWEKTITGDLTEGMTIKGEEQHDSSAPQHSTHISVHSRNLSDLTSASGSFGDIKAEVKGRKIRDLGKGDIGAVSADYELNSVLGEGGMGIVYRARQTAIDRSIAIKMIKGEATRDPNVRQKFLAEAAVTGDLDHPNIVPIHDLGDDGAGALFYAMKHVKGVPWCDVVKEKSLVENLEVLESVCNAIAFAHDHGVIHRDLKPENVMIGGYGEVLVMDWGLAASVSSKAKAEMLSSRTSVSGTPAYMSPEMAIGDGTKIGVVSDIYLLGAILFEILAGFAPHTGKTVMNCLENAALNVFRETDVTGELMDIALKAMSSEVKNRYQSVKEFQEAIKSYEEHYESIVLAEGAERNLSEAFASREYNDFSKSVYGFEQSLSMWKGNKRAVEGLSRARMAYAECAFAKEDYDLAESQLVEMTEDFRKLRNKVVDARAERDKRQRQLRTAKIAGVVAACVFILGICVGTYVIYGQMKIADQERLKAEANMKEANVQRAQAEAAREDAKAETERANAALEEASRAELARRLLEARQDKLKDYTRWAAKGNTPEERQQDAANKQKIAAEKHKLEIEKVITLPGEDVNIKLALIPDGIYTMGSHPDEKDRESNEPLHDVKVSEPFYMGVWEVTQDQWRALLPGKQPSKFKGPDVTGRYPVENITYEEIVTRFLPAIQKHAPAGWKFDLPTEAEWEYAVRAYSATAYHFGDDPQKLAEFAWFKKNSGNKTHPCGVKLPNAWGLYDMHGNVDEFCKDWFDENFYLRGEEDQTAKVEELFKKKNLTADDFNVIIKSIEDPFNGKDDTFRVTRGGSWMMLDKRCRSANRGSAHPVQRRSAFLGFRVVLRKITQENPTPAPAAEKAKQEPPAGQVGK